jgi:UDP-N-acetylglucosamine acyltransferase
MNALIHPTALIHPDAQIDPSVEVGPYSVIDGAVKVGPGCRIGPHVYLTGITTIGANNQFHAGAVIGNAPQDLKYKGEPTSLQIGDRNTFRENVTVNRSTSLDGLTVIGSNNLLMAGSHVAHDVVMGNETIIANGALLAGHVVVGDRAVVSGNCCVHQFVRIGTLAMMQGGSAVSQDLPPYTMVSATNELSGLNTIGLRRAGLTNEQRLEIRRLYHLLFRSGKPLKEALAQAREKFHSDAAKILIEFVATTKRGVCAIPLQARRSAASPDAGTETE